MGMLIGTWVVWIGMAVWLVAFWGGVVWWLV